MLTEKCQAKTWSQVQSGMEKGKPCVRAGRYLNSEGFTVCGHHYFKPPTFGYID